MKDWAFRIKLTYWRMMELSISLPYFLNMWISFTRSCKKDQWSSFIHCMCFLFRCTRQSVSLQHHLPKKVQHFYWPHQILQSRWWWNEEVEPPKDRPHFQDMVLAHPGVTIRNKIKWLICLTHNTSGCSSRSSRASHPSGFCLTHLQSTFHRIQVPVE